jgi:hypothetical protein
MNTKVDDVKCMMITLSMTTDDERMVIWIGGCYEIGAFCGGSWWHDTVNNPPRYDACGIVRPHRSFIIPPPTTPLVGTIGPSSTPAPSLQWSRNSHSNSINGVGVGSVGVATSGDNDDKKLSIDDELWMRSANCRTGALEFERYRPAYIESLLMNKANPNHVFRTIFLFSPSIIGLARVVWLIESIHRWSIVSPCLPNFLLFVAG